ANHNHWRLNSLAESEHDRRNRHRGKELAWPIGVSLGPLHHPPTHIRGTPSARSGGNRCFVCAANHGEPPFHRRRQTRRTSFAACWQTATSGRGFAWQTPTDS